MSVDAIFGLAKQQLERVKVLCTDIGLQYVDLPDQFPGVGIAIGFGETDYVVVSIMGGGSENQVMITAGLLNGIQQNRLAALETVNRFNQNNSAYPVYLHDAEAGWALLVQQTYPIELLLDAPDFFNQCVRALPQVVANYRTTIAENRDLGGQPWTWTAEDHRVLLIRSML